jgi:two-component system, NarL family, invasion response regulator UvrY
MTKILLVDDHAVARAGMRGLLTTEPGVAILEAESGGEALEICRRERPALVILDLNLGDLSGLEVLRRIVGFDKIIRVLVLSMHSEPIYAARALQAGARGYVSKSAGADEFVAAVRAVSRGERYIERELAAHLAVSKFSAKDPLDELTTREVDILRGLGEGKSYAEIASGIGVSYKTVANTSTRIKKKLGVDRTADLIRLSMENRRQ